jgi:hypothetical protein
LIDLTVAKKTLEREFMKERRAGHRGPPLSSVHIRNAYWLYTLVDTHQITCLIEALTDIVTLAGPDDGAMTLNGEYCPSAFTALVVECAIIAITGVGAFSFTMD